jgi:hypothetical protein
VGCSLCCQRGSSSRVMRTGDSSVLRELRMSLAPRAASAVAIARPRPPVAPVRSAVLRQGP